MARKILIGNAIEDRAIYVGPGYTVIDNNNIASSAGTLDYVQMYLTYSCSGIKVGIYDSIQSGDSVCRDIVTIGNSAAGSVAFTGTDLTVESGDAIGFYMASGGIDSTGTGGNCGVYYGDATTVGNTYTFGALYCDTHIVSISAGTRYAPTVTTQATSSVAAITATGNGNITNTGGNTATTRRGIWWDTSSKSAGAYGNDAYETGTFSTGAFTIAITGLPPSTKIYARAYSTDADNLTGSGDEVTFDTLAAIVRKMNHYRRMRA